MAELGVGNGRIAVEAAKRGKAIVGVDSSAAMLEVCRQRAAAAGVTDLISLIQADFRRFVLPEPASLISIPFHSIGHLTSREHRLEALRHIHAQLAPGGRLIFDTFVFNADVARAHNGTPRLRAEYRDDKTGHEVLLWVSALYDFEAQTIRIIAHTDELDERGVVSQRRYRRLSFSWSEPAEIRELLEETGFQVEALFGDYDRGPFDGTSQEQIWVARRP